MEDAKSPRRQSSCNSSLFDVSGGKSENAVENFENILTAPSVSPMNRIGAFNNSPRSDAPPYITPRYERQFAAPMYVTTNHEPQYSPSSMPCYTKLAPISEPQIMTSPRYAQQPQGHMDHHYVTAPYLQQLPRASPLYDPHYASHPRSYNDRQHPIVSPSHNLFVTPLWSPSRTPQIMSPSRIARSPLITSPATHRILSPHVLPGSDRQLFSPTHLMHPVAESEHRRKYANSFHQEGVELSHSQECNVQSECPTTRTNDSKLHKSGERIGRVEDENSVQAAVTLRLAKELEDSSSTQGDFLDESSSQSSMEVHLCLIRGVYTGPALEETPEHSVLEFRSGDETKLLELPWEKPSCRKDRCFPLIVHEANPSLTVEWSHSSKGFKQLIGTCCFDVNKMRSAGIIAGIAQSMVVSPNSEIVGHLDLRFCFFSVNKSGLADVPSPVPLPCCGREMVLEITVKHGVRGFEAKLGSPSAESGLPMLESSSTHVSTHSDGVSDDHEFDKSARLGQSVDGNCCDEGSQYAHECEEAVSSAISAK